MPRPSGRMILTATSEDALTIPVQAVVKRKLGEDGTELRGSDAKGAEETDVVYLIGDDNKAEVRAVTTGVSDVLAVEILDGLSKGDEVVVGPYRTLKNLHAGDTIRAEEKEGDEDRQSIANCRSQPLSDVSSISAGIVGCSRWRGSG